MLASTAACSVIVRLCCQGAAARPTLVRAGMSV